MNEKIEMYCLGYSWDPIFSKGANDKKYSIFINQRLKVNYAQKSNKTSAWLMAG